MSLFTIPLSLLFLSQFSSANQKAFDLKLDLMLNGKHLSTPRLKIANGDKGYISQKIQGEPEMLFVEVAPTEALEMPEKRAISIKVTLGRINSRGERVIISDAKMITLENESAEIKQKDDSGAEFGFSVIAKRVDL